MPKAFILKATSATFYSIAGRIRDTFPEGISLKVNVVAQLESEFAYYDVAAGHYAPFTKIVRCYNHLIRL